MKVFHNSWDDLLKEEFQKDYYKNLRELLVDEYRHYTIFPPARQLFYAFDLTPYEDVRCVILGQDPYHNIGQAEGLAFSVKQGVRVPPSLQNIYKELEADLGITPPHHGSLIDWAKSGVLLLNTTLSVRAHEPMSHAKIGWELFTDAVIRLIDRKADPVVFILWGAHAGTKAALIKNPKHLIIKSPHPSPLSAHRGFFGSKPFSRTNDFLVQSGQAPIDWRIYDNQ
ncbi:uracil-DNA glycosylase [Peptoniphilus equinus]|uniref:Uracil-DNA glycosylase n=1 Tax=Peptoniphilus equinus TaxID=3016343 RepID=A0ABY7QTM4_9FIRM|nr:uracil-DNA glycosylase [Peptoniphilus equinus]WBW50132.1 uracil-DNA glycosylase [Peptoniphilus equinus]